MISVFGTLCAIIAKSFGVWILMGGFLGVIAVILVGNFSHKKTFDTEKHSVLSTEVAMLVMYVVGILAGIGPLWLAAAAAGVLVIVLQLKIELHGLTARFNENEIKAFMQFVLISLIILPVVPDRTMGPFNVLNPHEIWLMVILIVAISLTGYVIYKFFGSKAGSLLGGILGGIISSTATTASYGRRSKGDPQYISHNAVIISLAWTTVYIRLMIEIAVAAPGFKTVYLPLLIITVVSIFATLWLWRHSENKQTSMPIQENPSELKTAFVFGALYAAIIFVSAAAKEYFGNQGLMAAAFISGVTDLDAITLSTSRLVYAGKILTTEEWPVILMAILSNLLFKGGIAAVLGGKKLLKALMVPLIGSVVAIILLLIFGGAKF